MRRCPAVKLWHQDSELLLLAHTARPTGGLQSAQKCHPQAALGASLGFQQCVS